jgi:hypothetical protein
MYYAEGGMARQADNLAAKGRGGDTMLVHMNPKEVGGLAALAQYGGDPMTINPDTGLPEAKSSFLKALLPTLVGFGLSFVPGLNVFAGASGALGGTLGGAITRGMITGGLRMLTGGNLQEGLMAGLGGYSGAQLGGALQGMGAAAGAGADLTTKVAEGEAAKTALAGQQSQTLAGTQLGNYGGMDFGANVNNAGIIGGGGGPSLATMNVSQPAYMSGAPQYSLAGASQGAGNVATDTATRAASDVASQVGPTYKQIPIENYEVINQDYLAGRAIPNQQYVMPGNAISKTGTLTYGKQLVPTPGTPMATYSGVEAGAKDLFTEGGFGRLAEQYPGGKLGLAALAGGPLIQDSMDQEEFKVAEPEKSPAGIYVPDERTYTQPTTQQILSSGGREFTYFTPSNPLPGYSFMPSAAKGGLLAMNKMAGGRYLKGAGDGTSDSIPATIGQNQPARLADGEFVVDARTVSEIGNGSSDAGARKLYAMMDNVHNARQNAERGKPSGADQYLKGLTATA